MCSLPRYVHEVGVFGQGLLGLGFSSTGCLLVVTARGFEPFVVTHDVVFLGRGLVGCSAMQHLLFFNEVPEDARLVQVGVLLSRFSLQISLGDEDSGCSLNQL